MGEAIHLFRLLIVSYDVWREHAFLMIVLLIALEATRHCKCSGPALANDVAIVIAGVKVQMA